MKKIFLLLMLLVPAMTFAGCSDGNDDPQTEIPDTPDNPGGDDNDGDEPGPVNPGNGKILIAYFSRWGNTNYPADVDASTGASIIINNGNRRGTTQVVADYIQAAVGGDIHLIETSDPYPVDFDDVRDLNHSEQANGTRPALKSRIENMAQYETVFIGYPVWATTVTARRAGPTTAGRARAARGTSSARTTRRRVSSSAASSATAKRCGATRRGIWGTSSSSSNTT